jgi:hypothetical protein
MNGSLIQSLLADELLTKAPLTPEEKSQVALLAAYQAEAAAKGQLQLNEAARRLGIKRDTHGQMRRVAIIDPRIIAQNRQVHGTKCWADPGFVKSFLKDNPEIKLPE